MGQPNLNITVDRAQAARYQINVADVQDAIQTAVGGNGLTQVLQNEARYDLVMRYQAQYRDQPDAIAKIRLLSPTGERVSLARARLAKIVPITILLISMILYMMFRSFQWAALILVKVLVGTVGGFVALLITNTNFQRVERCGDAGVHQSAAGAGISD